MPYGMPKWVPNGNAKVEECMRKRQAKGDKTEKVRMIRQCKAAIINAARANQ